MTEITGKPIGWLNVLQFPDGSYDVGPDTCGLWASRELAAIEAAGPEMAGQLADGQRWRACGVVPAEDGQG